MTHSSLAGKRILIIQQRNWGVNVGHFLAKKLAAEGALLAAVTYKKSAHEFHATQKDVRYEMLINNDAVFEDPSCYIKGAPASLEEITRELGLESIWPIVAGSREMTRSYGEAFYYSRRQQMSDDAIERYLQGAYAYVRKIFDEFKPDAIISPLLAEPSHLMMYHMGRLRGIRPLCAVDPKVRDVLILSESPWEDAGLFYERIDELNAGATSPHLERARQYIKEFREAFKRPKYIEKMYEGTPLWKRVRAEFAPYRRIWDWYVHPTHNRVGPLGSTLDNQPPHIILRDHYHRNAWTRAARHFPYFPIERIQKYVYYPLQVEPEVTLDVFAPFFSNQLELARQVALSLPSGFTLVVKDHPLMLGLRSPEFLKDMARTTNVKLIDQSIPNEYVLKNASLVVAPNSTSLAEAAFYGIPAIQFGNQGTTQKLPNVIRHTDMTTLVHVIQKCLSQKMGGEVYERHLANFVAAAYDAGFELNYDSAWYEGKNEELEKIWRMFYSGLSRILK